ncbi:uncharacterized protein [Antedon mediterranea]|uniref:uncharacterized protein n=1 Tax=Antedon mediterranea TaxID=105859 RepID=UPI003AF91DE0
MSNNILNAHGRKINVLPKNSFHRDKQQFDRPTVTPQRRSGDGCRWSGVCEPVKFVDLSQSIFNPCLIMSLVICFLCAAYLLSDLFLLKKTFVIFYYLPAVLLTISSLYIVYVLCFKVKNETIILIPSFGIQLERCYAFGRISTQFIPYDTVKDVVINEAISMYKVIYYLVILVKYSPVEDLSVIPLFTNCWPRLDTLCEIYNICQEGLLTYQQENTD